MYSTLFTLKHFIVFSMCFSDVCSEFSSRSVVSRRPAHLLRRTVRPGCVQHHSAPISGRQWPATCHRCRWRLQSFPANWRRRAAGSWRTTSADWRDRRRVCLQYNVVDRRPVWDRRSSTSFRFTRKYVAAAIYSDVDTDCERKRRKLFCRCLSLRCRRHRTAHSSDLFCFRWRRRRLQSGGDIFLDPPWHTLSGPPCKLYKYRSGNWPVK